MSLHQRQVVAVVQPVHLLCVQINDIQMQLLRPLKTGLLHTLHPQGKAIAFPVNALHDRSIRVAEDEQVRAERIQVLLGLNDRHEAVDGFSHVHRLAIQVDRATLVPGSEHLS